MRISNHQKGREDARSLPNLPQNRIRTFLNFPRSASGVRCVLASLSIEAVFPKAARGRARTPKLVAKAESVLCFAYFLFFFENFAARFPEKDIEEKGLRHKQGCVDFGAGPGVRVHGRYPS